MNAARRHAAMSRRAAIAAIAAAAPTMAMGRSAAPGLRSIEKAMWVWQDRLLQPDGLHSFCLAQNIGTVFLYVTPTAAEAILAKRSGAREVLAELRASGCRVFACCGEPDWAMGPTQLPRHLDLLVRIQSEIPSFDGLHLDVEPHALPAWQTPDGRAALIAGTLRFFNLVRAHSSGTPVDAAVNVVFADQTTRDGANFLGALARQLDSVSIMAYRNRAVAAVAWAMPAIRVVQRAERRWRMGVLVDRNDAEPGTSWSGTPAAEFAAAMTDLDGRLRTASPQGYAGLAFEGFDSLRAKLAG